MVHLLSGLRSANYKNKIRWTWLLLLRSSRLFGRVCLSWNKRITYLPTLSHSFVLSYATGTVVVNNTADVLYVQLRHLLNFLSYLCILHYLRMSNRVNEWIVVGWWCSGGCVDLSHAPNDPWTAALCHERTSCRRQSVYTIIKQFPWHHNLYYICEFRNIPGSSLAIQLLKCKIRGWGTLLSGLGACSWSYTAKRNTCTGLHGYSEGKVCKHDLAYQRSGRDLWVWIGL